MLRLKKWQKGLIMERKLVNAALEINRFVSQAPTDLNKMCKKGIMTEGGPRWCQIRQIYVFLTVHT